MKQTALWVVIIALVLLAGGYWWYLSGSQATPEDLAPTLNPQAKEKPFSDSSKDGGVVVTYTSDGFSPSTITVPVGSTVTFVNRSTEEMWVGSDEHPSHTGYAGTNKDEHCPDVSGTAFDQCGTGSSFSFTFTKTGTWGYHNHRESDHHGTVVVTE